MDTTTTMSALDPAHTQRRPLIRGGSPQIWQALSADGMWRYERVDDTGTPWMVTHLPTGATMSFGTLPDARRWTGDDDRALGDLHERALRVAIAHGYSEQPILRFEGGRLRRVAEDPVVAARRYATATRVLAVLEGDLVDERSPAARCHCLRLLAWHERTWRHADTCDSCAGTGTAVRRNCPDLHTHQACQRPEPITCGHEGCDRPAAAWGHGVLCVDARRSCCGCCAQPAVAPGRG